MSATADEASCYRMTMDACRPCPLRTLLCRLDGITAIARVWPAGAARRCRRCDRCAARDDACLVQTTECVPDADAPDYGLRGLDVEPPRDLPAGPTLTLVCDTEAA